jgi:hypothetical protein
MLVVWIVTMIVFIIFGASFVAVVVDKLCIRGNAWGLSRSNKGFPVYLGVVD